MIMESIVGNVISQEKPPWITEFIFKVGLPMSAFVAITIWALWRVDANIIAQGHSISTHLVDTSYAIKQNEEIKALIRAQIVIIQQVCANTAKSNSDRRLCFPTN